MNIPNTIFSVAEAERQGVARWKLAQMCRDGAIERLSRGIYAPKGHAAVELEIITLAKHGSDFVVALESALRFHGITTAQAMELTVAMKRGARKPAVDFPLRVVRLGQKSLTSGVETHVVGGEQIKVFSVAKTVADIFMFRNRIGMGLAIEALKEGFAKHLFTMDELVRHANANRVTKIMTPYMESLFA